MFNSGGGVIEKALFVCVNVNLFIRRSHPFGVFASPSYSELFQSDSMYTACLSALFSYQKKNEVLSMGAFEFGTTFWTRASLLRMWIDIDRITPSGRIENMKMIY